MATVKLKQEHLNKIIDITQDIVNWKSHSLSQKSWETFSNNWLPSLIEQIRDNEFKVNRQASCTPRWLIDQIHHCRKLADGVDPRHAVPLEDTKTAKEVIAICQAMTRGQLWYDGFAKNSEFHNLFN